MTASTTPVDVWTSTVSGLCATASNWSNGIPAWGGSVLVAPPTNITLTFNASNYTIGALTFEGATLYLRDGPLTVTTSSTFQNATILGPNSLTLGGTIQVTGLTLGGATTLDNQGVLTQSGGAVTVGAGATIANLTGANWIDADDSGIGTSATGSFVNAGTFTDSDAKGTTAVTSSFTSTGTVAVAAGGALVFAATGALTQLSGTLTGGGVVEYGPGEIATLGALTVAATNQDNLGTVNQVGTLTLNGAQSLENAGHWNLAGDVSIMAGAGANPANEIISTGVFAKTAGTGVSVIGASVEIAGALNVATGTLEFTNATDAFAGAISGAGTFEIASGVAEFEPGQLNNEAISVAHFLLAGGTAEVIGYVTDTGAFAGAAGANLAIQGALNLNGAATLSGLNVVGGELLLGGPAAVSGATLGGTAELFDNGNVTQAGGALTLGDNVAADAASLVLGAGGVWNITDASGIKLGADPYSTITLGQTGALLEKTGAGVSVISPGVLNNALDVASSGGVAYQGVEVASGTLDLHDYVAGSGSDNIVGAGTLEFDSAVGVGQTVAFFGAGGTLQLNDAPAFQGAIAGFDTAGSADTLLISAGSFKYTGATETAAAATLAFSYGASTFSLTLTGDYQGAFNATTLASGQIKITH